MKFEICVKHQNGASDIVVSFISISLVEFGDLVIQHVKVIWSFSTSYSAHLNFTHQDVAPSQFYIMLKAFNITERHVGVYNFCNINFVGVKFW